MAPAPAGTSRTIMYCLGCEYVLNGVNGLACPECGRFFSSRDVSSYATVRRRWYKKAFDAAIPAVLSLLGALNVLFACIVVAIVIVAAGSARDPGVLIAAFVALGCCATIAAACFKVALRPKLP